MTRSFALWAGFVLAALASPGCENRPQPVPAEGVLTIGGKPAANISVQFMPDALQGSKGPTSFAITDAEGKFQLVTQDGQTGAMPGPHTVILADLEEERPPQGKPVTKPARLDSKYTTASGGLRVEVPAAGGAVVLTVPAQGR